MSKLLLQWCILLQWTLYLKTLYLNIERRRSHSCQTGELVNYETSLT